VEVAPTLGSATSTNGGVTWTKGYLPGITIYQGERTRGQRCGGWRMTLCITLADLDAAHRQQHFGGGEQVD